MPRGTRATIRIPSRAMSHPAVPAELLPAMAIFLKELEGHIKAIELTLVQIGSATSLTEDTRKSLGNRMHVIKGGAGFFKLESLKNQATIAEQSMTSADARTEELLKEFLSNLQAEIATLKEAFGQRGCSLF